MQQKHGLDYYATPDKARSLTVCEWIGRVIAISSFVLPFLTFQTLTAIPALQDWGQAGFAHSLWLFLLALSCLLGLTGLSGIPWWGNRWVWAPSLLGIAFSVSWFLLVKYGA